MNIYMAGPIFTLGDKFRNDYFYSKLKEAFPTADIYDPLQNTDINGVEGKKKFAGSKEIAKGDNERLNNTDVLIATIDGDVLPSGTCAEIGKFHEKIERGDHKYIIGICTDNRQCYLTHSQAKDDGGAASLGEQQYSYQNLYVTGLIKQYGKLVYTIDEVIEYIKTFANEFDGNYHGKVIDKKYWDDPVNCCKKIQYTYADGYTQVVESSLYVDEVVPMGYGGDCVNDI